MAGEIIEGSLSTQSIKLWDYAEELKKTNPGSTVVINIELGPGDKNKFKRIYISFNACKKGITFMTDRQKGLIESIGDIWPNCEHSFYVRHIYANFKKKFKDDKIRGKCGRQQDQPHLMTSKSVCHKSKT
ncbi:hypothetical protein Ddye_016754 [Dipteronia dyeriana]|uniref:MULE transposase domain-containing protein n=1 Tax=Dipteronia dyeriana TaxID=168575 RepID=A0AAD9U7B7_9ROSI|nr:hypothetical protein Ddye_016754 [Dipteronia dyeriana]